MRLTVSRNTLIHLVRIGSHIVIILEHETALHDVPARVLRKSGICDSLLEPAESRMKIVYLIFHISKYVLGRSCKSCHRP